MTAPRQTGVTTVEMAIVAALMLVVLFAVLEVGRAFFTMNALEEATRRGARVGVVCQVNDPAIQQIASFADIALVGGLTPAHIQVDYLANDGSVVGDPMGAYTTISFVRVSVSDYRHQLLIPFFFRTITLPAFATTLPRESLGVSREGFTTC
jgi:hypothetical protein